MDVVVCGGSRGIGRAIAVGLAQPNARIFINFRSSQADAEEVRTEVEARGAQAILVPGDISTPDGADEVFRLIGERTDHLDALIHSVVRTVSGPLLDADPKAYLDAVQVNAMSLLYAVQSANQMLGRGSSVIYLSSRGSRIALKDYASVGAPKAFAEGMIRYLAVELAARGARANTISPTAQDTAAFRDVFPDDYEARLRAAAERNPSGRAVDLDDIVGTVRFLISPAASMVQGQVITLDGGAGLVG